MYIWIYIYIYIYRERERERERERDETDRERDRKGENRARKRERESYVNMRPIPRPGLQPDPGSTECYLRCNVLSKMYLMLYEVQFMLAWV